MKQIIAILLPIILCLGICGCGVSNDATSIPVETTVPEETHDEPSTVEINGETYEINSNAKSLGTNTREDTLSLNDVTIYYTHPTTWTYKEVDNGSLFGVQFFSDAEAPEYTLYFLQYNLQDEDVDSFEYVDDVFNHMAESEGYEVGPVSHLTVDGHKAGCAKVYNTAKSGERYEYICYHIIFPENNTMLRLIGYADTATIPENILTEISTVVNSLRFEIL